MNGVVVVDASVAVKLVVAEPHSDKVATLFREWAREGVQPIAPSLMAVEAANALYQRVRLDQLTIEEASALLEALLSVGIQFQNEPFLHQRALALSHRLNLPAVYDAHYLALAERQACLLWTADQRLFNMARPSLPWVNWVGDYGAGE